jgi:SHS2 domain-containing protein
VKRNGPKKGRRLPLPRKAGAPMGTKKGAKGYRRDVSEIEDEGSSTQRASCEKPSYEIIDHTADLGIKVSGDSLERVFECAGLAMFDLLTDFKSIRPDTRMSFSLSADNLEALFVQWLRELLYLFFGQERLFCAFEMTRLSETDLTVTGWGERFDPKKHATLTEIKAVTYHELSVKRTESGWTAQVIFDV